MATKPKRVITPLAEDLESYQSHHPSDHKDPTALELHCDLNPDAPECRVYDD